MHSSHWMTWRGVKSQWWCHLYWAEIQSNEGRMNKQQLQWNVQTASISSIFPVQNSVMHCLGQIGMFWRRLINQMLDIVNVFHWHTTCLTVIVASQSDMAMAPPILPQLVDDVVNFLITDCICSNRMECWAELAHHWQCIPYKNQYAENLVI